MAEAPRDIDRLSTAAVRGDLTETIRIIQNNINVNEKNKLGRTPLQVVKLGCPSVVEVLLSAGSDPNVRDPVKGLTVTHDVARDGYADTLLVLLRFNADVNLQDDDGNLPLHLAAHEGHKRVVELLAPRTTNPSQPNHAGFTPLQLATQHGRDGAAGWLKNYQHVSE